MTEAPIAGKPGSTPLTNPCSFPGSWPRDDVNIASLVWALGRIPPLMTRPPSATAPVIPIIVQITIFRTDGFFLALLFYF